MRMFDMYMYICVCMYNRKPPLDMPCEKASNHPPKPRHFFF